MMKKIKVILTAPMVTKKGSINVGEALSLPADEAYSFYKNKTVEMDKKDIDYAKSEIKKSLEEKDKKERALELSLQKEELEAEKETLQARLAEINKTLKVKAK